MVDLYAILLELIVLRASFAVDAPPDDAWRATAETSGRYAFLLAAREHVLRDAARIGGEDGELYRALAAWLPDHETYPCSALARAAYDAVVSRRSEGGAAAGTLH